MNRYNSKPYTSGLFLGTSLIVGALSQGCIGLSEPPAINNQTLAQSENAVVANNGTLYIANHNKVTAFDHIDTQAARIAFESGDCAQVTGLAHAHNRLYIACLDQNQSAIEQQSSLYILDLNTHFEQRIALQEQPMLANGISVLNQQVYISNSYLNLDFTNRLGLSEIIRVSLNEDDFGQQYSALQRSNKGLLPNGLQAHNDYLYYLDGKHFNQLSLDETGNIESVNALHTFTGMADDFSIDQGLAYIATFAGPQQNIKVLNLQGEVQQTLATPGYISSATVWFEDQLYATSFFNGGLYRVDTDNKSRE